MAMESGDDYVAYRVSIDIPDSTSEDVRRITQEVDRFRTVLEAASRAESDATRYLDQMSEAASRASEAQAHLVQQLQTVMSLSERSGASPPSSSVPLGGARDPFYGGSAGTGTERTPQGIRDQLNDAQQTSPREWLNMQHARGALNQQDTTSLTPKTIQDLANRISSREHEQREQDRLTHIGTGGAGRGEPTDHLRAEQRIRQAHTLANRVMNEVGPGGSVASMGRMVLDGINWAKRRHSADAPGRGDSNSTNEGFEGGDLTGVTLPPSGGPGTGSSPKTVSPSAQTVGAHGGLPGIGGALGGAGRSILGGLGPIGALLSKLEPIAGPLGMALGAYGIFEKGGAVVQGLRNQGSIRGGAAGEGALSEARAKILAMNPFISQDQARQIYQSVMSEGYADASGAGADNVVDFMKHNLTSLNMSVADSAKVLRDTIIGGGQGDKRGVNDAIQMLSKELDSIRTLSRGSVMSQPEFRQGVMGLQQSLMDMGSTPEQAEQTALTAETVESGSQTMKGQFAGVAQGLATPSGGAWLRAYGGPGGTPLRGLDPRMFPQVTAEALQEKGGGAYNEAVENALQAVAKQSAMGGGPEENQVYLFQQRLRAMGVNVNATQSLSAAKELYEDVRSGNQGDAVKKAEQQIAQDGPSTTGKGRDGGGQHMSGNVTIDLTPAAARMFRVQGGNTITLTPTQRAANRGIGDNRTNNDPDAMT